MREYGVYQCKYEDRDDTTKHVLIKSFPLESFARDLLWLLVSDEIEKNGHIVSHFYVDVISK